MTAKNSQGGVNGGITNGMPIIFRTAVKPTPSISKTQKTVNIATMENTEISVNGRHDPAIIHRVRAVVDAVSAIAVADMLITKYGVDCLSN
jgi:chorismate synthase